MPAPRIAIPGMREFELENLAVMSLEALCLKIAVADLGNFENKFKQNKTQQTSIKKMSCDFCLFWPFGLAKGQKVPKVEMATHRLNLRND